MPPSLTTTQLYNWKWSGFCRTIPAYPCFVLKVKYWGIRGARVNMWSGGGSGARARLGWVTTSVQCPSPGHRRIFTVVFSWSLDVAGETSPTPAPTEACSTELYCDTLWARTFSFGEWIHNNWRAHGVTLDGNISALHFEKNCDSTCSHIEVGAVSIIRQFQIASYRQGRRKKRD